MSAQAEFSPARPAQRHAPEALFTLPEAGSRTYYCYALIAEPEPGLLPRVLEFIAKRGLVPYRCHATVEGQNDATLSIDLQVCGLDDWSADHVGQSLRQIVGVHTVLMSRLTR
jgi:acetolactate synthase regulatory subunit